MIIITQLSSGKVFKRSSSSAHVPPQLASRCATLRWLIVGGLQINNRRQLRETSQQFRVIWLTVMMCLLRKLNRFSFLRIWRFIWTATLVKVGITQFAAPVCVCVCVRYWGCQHAYLHTWQQIGSPVWLLLTCEDRRTCLFGETAG